MDAVDRIVFRQLLQSAAVIKRTASVRRTSHLTSDEAVKLYNGELMLRQQARALANGHRVPLLGIPRWAGVREWQIRNAKGV